MKETVVKCDRCGKGGAQTYSISKGRYIDASGNYDWKTEDIDLCKACASALIFMSLNK